MLAATSGVHGAVGLHDDIGGDHRPRLARQAAAEALNDRAQRDDGADADGDAEEEEEQPPPGRAELANGHAQDEAFSQSSRQSQSSRHPVGSLASRRTRPAVAGVRRRRACDDAPVAQRDASCRRSRASSGSCVTSTSVACATRWISQQQVDDVTAGGAVEVAGRLVGEQDRRVVRQRPGNRDALLFAARELRRIVVAAVREARLRRAAPWPARAASRAARDLHRHEHVLEARSATAADGRTGTRSRSACRAAAPARPRRAR